MWCCCFTMPEFYLVAQGDCGAANHIGFTAGCFPTLPCAVCIGILGQSTALAADTTLGLIASLQFDSIQHGGNKK